MMAAPRTRWLPWPRRRTVEIPDRVSLEAGLFVTTPLLLAGSAHDSTRI